MTANELIGIIVYRRDGAQITGRKITEIIEDKENQKWLAYADMPDRVGGVHIGPCNSEAQLIKRVMSMTAKPKLTQADPIFVGYAQGAYTALEVTSAK